MNIIKTLYRMKHALIIIFAVLLTLPLFSQDEKSSETSTYYFIRHAEKDRSDTSNHDPYLLEKGKLRAEHWASVFKNINYVINCQRVGLRPHSLGLSHCIIIIIITISQ